MWKVADHSAASLLDEDPGMLGMNGPRGLDHQERIHFI